MGFCDFYGGMMVFGKVKRFCWLVLYIIDFILVGFSFVVKLGKGNFRDSIWLVIWFCGFVVLWRWNVEKYYDLFCILD